MTTTTRTADGIEASRRAGWAKFFSEKEENEALRYENDRLKWLVRHLSKKIVLHVRLSGDDDLVVLARELEKSV